MPKNNPKVESRRYFHRTLRFRRGRDIMDVVPNQCPNITELLEKDAIQDKSVPSLFNQIEDFADIGMRVRNKFDILNYQTSFTRIRGARKDSSSESNE